MATKNIKSVGDIYLPVNKINGQSVSYWKNAAKQIEWPVDITERHISVPEREINKAKENLMVQHFLNNGFFIQLSMTEQKTKVFDPEIKLKLPAVKIAPDNALFHIGDRFKINSTLCEIEICVTESKKIHFKYLNRNKPNFIQSEEQISKNLSWNLWVKL